MAPKLRMVAVLQETDLDVDWLWEGADMVVKVKKNGDGTQADPKHYRTKKLVKVHRGNFVTISFRPHPNDPRFTKR